MRPLTRATGPLALVVALLALVVAVGGTSYAAVTLAKNSVGAKQLKAGAVTGAKVKDASLTAADFAAGQLGGAGGTGAAGPAGPAGPAGAPGQTGAPGANGTVSGWAVINVGTGAVSSTGGARPLTDADVARTALGVVEITGSGWGSFLSPVPVGATLQGSAAGSATYQAPQLQGITPPTVVPTRVRTFDRFGDPADRVVLVWTP